MRLSPFSRAAFLLTILAFVVVFALAACSSGSDAAGSGTALPTLVTIATADPSAAEARDPIAKGEAIFKGNNCSGCHSTGSDQIVGPGLAEVGDNAATRVSGLSADDYLEQSIREPGAFIVDGFSDGMPAIFTDLSETEMSDLVAFLKSL
ncbi:MAG: cytochrome c [Dehalococcoidia bacterium]|jgi:cytochrome c551/c552|nr:cytochrome c [Dehalococcoidia bacterium]